MIQKPDLPTPRRVVIGAGAHAALAKELLERRPELEVRGKTYTEITTSDLEWADTYVGFKRPPLPTMGNVRWVHCTGAGVDAWLHPTELPREILLTRTSESFGVYIAEWALSRALAFRQQLIDLADAQRRHEWSPREVGYVRDSRAVVVGTGDVGTHIARLFSSLGAKVHGVSRSGRGDRSVFASTSTVSELQNLVREADWLIVTLPLTSDTRGLIGRDVLSVCRGVVLMNSGRGAVVDEALIPEALEKGWLAGAILDVFETEPLPPDHVFWRLPNVRITAHTAALSTPPDIAPIFIDNYRRLLRGEPLRYRVDFERGY